MTEKPLVSIIIIFLNEERFLEEAIRSVLSQTYDNWELLLVDDGSTDNSKEIAKKYAKNFSEKIRYYDHEGHKNMGMSATRNLGIENIRGDYVSFLDADDVYFPNKLNSQVQLLMSNPDAAIVYGPAVWWYSWSEETKIIKKDFIQKFEAEKNTLLAPPSQLILLLKNSQNVPLPSAILIRSDAIFSVKGFENSFRGMYEDQVFFAKIFLMMPVYISDICMCKYRQHPEACTSVAKASKKSCHYRVAFLNWLESYLLLQKHHDSRILRIIKKELFPYRHPFLNKIKKKIKGIIDRHVKSQ